MKKLIIILLSLTVINTMAQKDTIYFNKHWEKVTKDKAKYYRIVPLKKIGDLHQITDYYMNGNPQMEGFWSDIKNEIFEGETKWYFKNGTLSEITNYKNGLKEGLSKSYLITGELKTSGTYKKDKPFNGTFIPPCASCDVSEYKEGIKTKYYQYYRDTNKIAEKSVVNTANEIIKQTYYDRDGKQIGEVTMKFYESPIDGKIVYFDIDNDKHIIGISNTAHFKDKKLEGEAIDYNLKTGEILAKGIYKSGAPYNGTFSNYLDNNITTYKNGVKDGEVILFSDKREFIGKGVYKNGERWSGHFYDVYYNSFKTIVNYKEGEMLGKQVSYYTTNFEKIAETSHIKNGEKDGKVASYNKEGKLLAKGIYKDNKQWSGSFYDFYTYELTSYKKGKKHGKYIQYTTNGEIIYEKEYKEGELSGKIKSTGYLTNKECECIYKEDKPYKGEVCSDDAVDTFKKGKLIKRATYRNEDYAQPKSIWWYKDNYAYKRDKFIDGKKYSLIYKDDKPYEGENYSEYDGTLYTFKNGVLNGPFAMNLGYSPFYISGNYVNNNYEGIITFENRMTGGKTTTCLYKKGKPIDGTIFTEEFITNYKDAHKIGKEIGLKPREFKINGKYQLVYDYLERNYNENGQLDGDVQFYKNDELAFTSTYKDGKKYDGVFYPSDFVKEHFKQGEIIKTRTSSGDYHIIKKFEKGNLISETVEKFGKKIYKGTYKNGNPFNGKFGKFIDELGEDKMYQLTQYKDGKKDGSQTTMSDIANEKTYNIKKFKKGELLTETWTAHQIENKEIIEGVYKNNKPYSGYFYKYDIRYATLNHYKEGLKHGKQYFGKNSDNKFKIKSSIAYDNGIPLDGNEVIPHRDQLHEHIYKNGQRVETRIHHWRVSEIPNTIVTYNNKGFTTAIHLIDDKYEKLNELVYSNTSKTNGDVVYYEKKKQLGKLKFQNNIITELNIKFKQSDHTNEIYLDAKNRIVLKALYGDLTVMLYPKIENNEVLNYTDFINVERDLMGNEGIGYFYLKGEKEPVSSCTVKDGKEINGTVIYYNYNNDNKYLYKEYKNSKRIKKVSDLSKKQLIKALK